MSLRLEEFDYELPPDRIAQQPAPRGHSRLLVVGAGSGRHRRIGDLARLLEPGDLLVVNDSKVLPARLVARRSPGGGRVELLLVERLGPRRWTALARPARRLTAGSRLELEDGLAVTVESEAGDGLFRLVAEAPLRAAMERFGHVPLPPYIRRPDDADDRHRYQTAFARRPGSVAAPTAGLHFGPELLAALTRRGVGIARLTLHVGPGTFQPIRGGSIEDHRMASERYRLPAATAEAVARTRRGGGRVVAVGTTVVRVLETVAASGRIEPGAGRTDLFIRPGFRFRAIDLLLTNFHLPRSTLLLLVCAFGGRERVLAAYREAVAAGYRFYSYGDAMLVSPASDS